MKINKALNQVNGIRRVLGYGKYLFDIRELKEIVKTLEETDEKDDEVQTGTFRFLLKERAGERCLRIIPDFRFNIKLKELESSDRECANCGKPFNFNTHPNWDCKIKKLKGEKK